MEKRRHTTGIKALAESGWPPGARDQMAALHAGLEPIE